MGLDMYLSAEKYVSGYDFEEEPERAEYRRALDAAGLTGFQCPEAPSATISVTVAYWRKANQIHNWFVQNCGNGKDEGQSFPVERSDLETLRDLCKRLLSELKTEPGKVHNGTTFYPDGRKEETFVDGRVITNKELAEELLPTRSGFFFGSTDYTEGYLLDLEDTVKQLAAILDDPRFAEFDFKYRPSW